MAALSVEKLNEDTSVSSNSGVGSVHSGLTTGGSVTQRPIAPAEGIATGIAKSYHTAESPAIEPEATIEEAPIPMVPSEITAPDTATEASPPPVVVEGVQEGVKDEVEERSFFDKIYDYLLADEDSIKSKAIFVKKKHDLKKKYGDAAVVEPNLTSILQIEDDMFAADDVRQQKQFALEIAMANKQKLYYESLECLALNGFHEARDQTVDQEVATGAVVMNRLSVNFRGATTVCEVIYTPKQFSWIEQHGTHTPDTSNKLEKQAWERSLLIARRLLDTDATYFDPSNGGLYYYNPDLVDWKYKHAYVQVAVLGSHRFMTEPDVNHPYRIDNTKIRINPALLNGLTRSERTLLTEKFQSKVGD